MGGRGGSSFSSGTVSGKKALEMIAERTSGGSFKAKEHKRLASIASGIAGTKKGEDLANSRLIRNVEVASGRKTISGADVVDWSKGNNRPLELDNASWSMLKASSSIALNSLTPDEIAIGSQFRKLIAKGAKVKVA